MPKRVDLSGVVGATDSREGLRQPYFDGEYLLASEGHAMVVLKVESDEGDVPGTVPLEALKAAQKCGGTLLLKDGAAVVLSSGVSFPRPEGKFPMHWKEIVDGTKPSLDSMSTYRVCFDIELLAKLAKAVGVPRGGARVVMTFKLGDDAPDAAPTHPLWLEFEQGAETAAVLLMGCSIAKMAVDSEARTRMIPTLNVLKTIEESAKPKTK